ncbi:MAG: hypothetical protein J6K12_04950 [Clostridia bacterium]|nr:hypothetical protein [Clostridia bacterium]
MNYIHNDSEHYFAAANTAMGFKSYFPYIFNIEDCDKLYILKGGPGVGKSTFMKKVGQFCENKGLNVEYYRCSSDPDSLDGIVIKELKIAIADGTSPHSIEASLAGAYEEIIDLGKAWDTEDLFCKRGKLQMLSKEKKHCYENAYEILYTCRHIKGILSEMCKSHILHEKAEKSVQRLAKSVLSKKNVCKGEEKIRLINALSCKGKIHLCSFEDKAKMCVFIKESKKAYGLGVYYITKLYEVAKKRGAEMLVSFSPFDTSFVDGLYFVNEKISVTLYSDELVSLCDKSAKKCRIINSDVFMDLKAMSQTKKERKFYEKLILSLEEKALAQLEQAGKVHLYLESVYSKSTNYSVVEKALEEFLENLTKRQKLLQ